MTVTTDTAGITDRNLTAALQTVVTEISRTDSKASMLLAFNGAVLAGLTTLADAPAAPAARICGMTAGLALGAAAVLLLLVVRPRLANKDHASFAHWAHLDTDTIATSMTTDARPARIRTLSGIALAKYRLLRRAVDLSLTALTLLAAAGITAQ